MNGSNGSRPSSLVRPSGIVRPSSLVRPSGTVRPSSRLHPSSVVRASVATLPCSVSRLPLKSFNTVDVQTQTVSELELAQSKANELREEAERLREEADFMQAIADSLELDRDLKIAHENELASDSLIATILQEEENQKQKLYDANDNATASQKLQKTAASPKQSIQEKIDEAADLLWNKSIKELNEIWDARAESDRQKTGASTNMQLAPTAHFLGVDSEAQCVIYRSPLSNLPQKCTVCFCQSLCTHK